MQILRLTSDRLSKIGTFCGFGYYAFTASNTAGNPGTFLSSEIFLHFSLAVEHAVEQFNRAAKLAFLISDRRYCDQLFLTQFTSESGHFDEIGCQRRTNHVLHIPKLYI